VSDAIPTLTGVTSIAEETVVASQSLRAAVRNEHGNAVTQEAHIIGARIAVVGARLEILGTRVEHAPDQRVTTVFGALFPVVAHERIALATRHRITGVCPTRVTALAIEGRPWPTAAREACLLSVAHIFIGAPGPVGLRDASTAQSRLARVMGADVAVVTVFYLTRTGTPITVLRRSSSVVAGLRKLGDGVATDWTGNETVRSIALTPRAHDQRIDIGLWQYRAAQDRRGVYGVKERVRAVQGLASPASV
jgi:hypothetical protein